MLGQGQGKKLSEAARLLARGELQIGLEPETTTSTTDAEELDESLAAFGLVLEQPPADDRPPPYYLWPEHEPVLGLWLQVQTQWRVGMNGATGLDYAGVQALVAMRQLATPEQLPELIEGLQIMERATLNEWAEQAERRARSSR